MKYVKIMAVLIVSLACTGCIDVFQYVSIQDSEVDLVLRYTIQKSLIEMAGEFSGEEIDINELVEQATSTVLDSEDFIINGKPINTSFVAGAEFRIQGDLDKAKGEDEEAYFLPIKNKDHYSILIPSMADQDEMDAMAIPFLAGATYTLLIDLRGDLKGIKEARLEYEGIVMELSEEDSEILVTHFGSLMQIEIPLLLLFYSPVDFYLELY